MTTLVVPVTHARRHLHRLVKRVHDEGVEVIILRYRRAWAVLLPYTASQEQGRAIGAPEAPLASLVPIDEYRRLRRLQNSSTH